MCINPMRASITEPGKPPVLSRDGDLQLPCNKCHECLKLRSSLWAKRVQHELSLHTENSFITLTYNDDNLPSLHDFKKRQLFTLFLKSLREKLYPEKIKYIASHEYGTKTHRPHHHLIIFGWCPSHWKLHSYSAKKNPIYTSDELTKFWNHGHSSVGPATPSSAYYIASYALKSKTHTYTDPSTGEIMLFKDKMTCSQSLGLDYFTKHQDSLTEYEILPRYYLKLLKEKLDLEQDPNTIYSKKLSQRLRKLQNLNSSLYHHYKSRIEQLPPKERNSLQKLASLEIEESKNNIQKTDLRSDPSSHDQQQSKLMKDSLSYYIKKEI